MRTSRESFARTRKEIIDAAGKLFVQKGFSSIGVAEVMRAAGLTHGGFYGHFNSKEDLAYEASKKLFEDYERYWREIVRSSPNEPARTLLAEYFAAEKSSHSDTRCILTSLSQEAGLKKSAVQGAFSEGVEALVRVLEESVAGDNQEDRRRVALAMLSSMVGAVTLARAMDNPELAAELLSATMTELASVARRAPDLVSQPPT
jgi:TetR/AcrR family transcriptional repressor of nem operon